MLIENNNHKEKRRYFRTEWAISKTILKTEDSNEPKFVTVRFVFTKLVLILKYLKYLNIYNNIYNIYI